MRVPQHATEDPDTASTPRANPVAQPGPARHQGAAPADPSPSVRCPHCGAVLPPEPFALEMQCPSCEMTISIPGSTAARAQRTVPSAAEDGPIIDDSDHGGSSGWELAESDGEYKFRDDPPVADPHAGWQRTASASSTFESPVPARKKKKRKNRLEFLEEIVDRPVLLAFFGGLVVVALMAAGFLSPALAFALRLVGGLIATAGFIWAIRLAFDESATCGALYLLDCTSVYRLYYTITRWTDMKHAFMLEIAGSLLFVPWAYQTFDSDVLRVGPNMPIEAEVDEDLPAIPAWMDPGP